MRPLLIATLLLTPATLFADSSLPKENVKSIDESWPARCVKILSAARDSLERDKDHRLEHAAVEVIEGGKAVSWRTDSRYGRVFAAVALDDNGRTLDDPWNEVIQDDDQAPERRWYRRSHGYAGMVAIDQLRDVLARRKSEPLMRALRDAVDQCLATPPKKHASIEGRHPMEGVIDLEWCRPDVLRAPSVIEVDRARCVASGR